MGHEESKVAVEAENLRQEFDSKHGNVVTLDGVSSQVKEGAIFGVLDPTLRVRRPWLGYSPRSSFQSLEL